MSGFSDLVEDFSFSANLLAGQSYTSPKAILGQYVSISTLVKSDVEVLVTYQFSADGANWDYSIVKNFSASIGSWDSTGVLSKWTRIIIQNNDISNSTFLRVYSYASTASTALSARLTKIGNFSPEVAVDSFTGMQTKAATGGLSVSSLTPWPLNQFDQGRHVATTARIWNGVVLEDYFAYKINLFATSLLTSSFSTSNNALVLCGMGGFAGDHQVVQFDYAIGNKAGQSNSYIFSSVFSNLTAGDYKQLLGVFVKPDLSITAIESGVGIGWNGTEYGLAIYYDTTETFVTQNSWNQDHLDGNGKSNATVDFELPNLWKIALIDLCNISLFWYNPSVGDFIPVHTYRAANTLSVQPLSSQGGQFLLQMEKLTTTNHLLSLDYQVGNFSFGAFAESSLTPANPLCYGKTIAGVTNTLVTAFALQNNYLMNNKYMAVACRLKNLILSCVPAAGGGATASVIVSIYLNPTFSVAPTWVKLSPSGSPIYHNNSTGTVGSTGVLVYEFSVVGSGDSKHELDEIFIPPGGYVLVMLQATAAVSHNVHISTNLEHFF